MRSLAALRALALATAVLSADAGASLAQAPLKAAAEPSAERRILVMLRMSPQHFRPSGDYGGSYGDGEGRSARWNVALRLARKQGVALVDEWPMPLLGVDCYVMAVPEGQSQQETAARIASDPAVAWSEPMHTYRGQSAAVGKTAPAGKGLPVSQGGAAAQPNDPLYLAQPAAREWRLSALHLISTGRNVRVAVIDSMIDATQPDLLGQLDLRENFASTHSTAPEDHGTGVAGVIAARANNGVGIVGIAPDARLMGLRACWEEPATSGASPRATVCDSLSLAKALGAAIERKAQIVNMSLSGPSDLLIGRLLDIALKRDMTVVAAYDRDLPDGGFPASHHGVVAVVAEASGTPIAGVFSAPGRDVPTTEPGGRWGLVNGSSFAAAHVSGLFALLRQREPASHDASALVPARLAGTIDVCATLMQKGDPCNCGCAPGHERLATAIR
jgi:subtilisin family serine protease